MSKTQKILFISILDLWIHSWFLNHFNSRIYHVGISNLKMEVYGFVFCWIYTRNIWNIFPSLIKITTINQIINLKCSSSIAFTQSQQIYPILQLKWELPIKKIVYTKLSSKHFSWKKNNMTKVDGEAINFHCECSTNCSGIIFQWTYGSFLHISICIYL